MTGRHGLSQIAARTWRVVVVVSFLMVATTPTSTRAQGGARLPRTGPESPVTAVDLRQGQASQNSPALAARSPDGRLLALANRIDSPEFGCSLHISTSGGRLWRPATPVPRLPRGAEKCYAPEVAFDGEGKLYFLFVGLHGAGNSPIGVFLTHSDDEGRSFAEPRRVLGPERYMVRLAIDPRAGSQGRLHLVWLEAGADPPVGGLPPSPNPILAAFSDDGGEHFSTPVQVSDPERRRVVAPAVAVGRRGTVHVLYYDLEDDVRDYQGLEGPTWEGTWSLMLASSEDGGREFARHSVVDDAVVPPERVLLIFTMPPPALVADEVGGVFAAWHDGRNADWDVFLRRSPDGGRSWGEPLRVNDDPAGNGRHQYLPRLAVSPRGRLDAVFYDRRQDSDNVRHDVYFAFSEDGGRRLAPNLRLTTKSSDTRIGRRYELPSKVLNVELGSRLALVSGTGSAVAAWADARNSLAGAQQDIVSTRVNFPGADSPAPRRSSDRGPASSLVAVLAGLALAGGLVVWRARTAGRGRDEI